MKTAVMLSSVKSYHGIQMDEIKSGAQKVPIRRSDWKNGQWYIKEWLLMKELDSQSEKQAKAVLSNLKNRMLEIFLYEDILGFSQWWLVEAVKNHFQIWEKKNRDPYTAGMEIYNAALKMCYWGRKCRFGSDVRAMYGNGLSAEEKQPLLSENLIAFKKNFQKKDNLVFKALFMLIDDTKMMRKVFAFLLNYIPQMQTSKSKYKHKKQIEYLESLFFTDRTRQERFLYPVHAIYSLYYPNEIEFDMPNNNLKPLPFITDEKEWKVVLDQHKSNPVHILEEYVIDMHTKAGRKLGKNGIDFIEEGMKVIPEDKQFLVVEWRNKYIALKKANPEKNKVEKKNKKRKAESDQEEEEEEEEEETKSSNHHSDNMNIDFEEKEDEIKEMKKKKKKMNQIKFQLNVYNYLNEIKSKITQVLPKNELNAAKDSNFVGQKVTSSYKQVVLITPMYVYKGPYDIKEGETCKRIVQTINRYDYFQKLDINVPQLNFVWEEGKIGSILWQKMEQIGSNKDQSTWKVKEYIDEMVNGYKGSILDRRSFGVETGSNITDQEWKANPKAMISALIIIFLRYVFDPPIGDSGLWNCLIRLKDFKVYCIDYEEEWGIIEKLDQSKVSAIKWYAILSPRIHAWSKDRIALFESILGLGSKTIHPDLLSSWNDMKLKIIQYQIPHSSIRMSNIDTIIRNVL